MGKGASVDRRTRLVAATIGLMGALMALAFAVILGYFLLTDGHTLLGDEYLGDPEFQRYWMVNLAPLGLGLAMAWFGEEFRTRAA